MQQDLGIENWQLSFIQEIFTFFAVTKEKNLCNRKFYKKKYSLGGSNFCYTFRCYKFHDWLLYYSDSLQYVAIRLANDVSGSILCNFTLTWGSPSSSSWTIRPRVILESSAITSSIWFSRLIVVIDYSISIVEGYFSSLPSSREVSSTWLASWPMPSSFVATYSKDKSSSFHLLKIVSAGQSKFRNSRCFWITKLPIFSISTSSFLIVL